MAASLISAKKRINASCKSLIGCAVLGTLLGSANVNAQVVSHTATGKTTYFGSSSEGNRFAFGWQTRSTPNQSAAHAPSASGEKKSAGVYRGVAANPGTTVQALGRSNILGAGSSTSRFAPSAFGMGSAGNAPRSPLAPGLYKFVDQGGRVTYSDSTSGSSGAGAAPSAPTMGAPKVVKPPVVVGTASGTAPTTPGPAVSRPSPATPAAASSPPATTPVATTSTPPPAPPTVSAQGRLHVDGKHFKDEKGNVVVLRGVSTIGVGMTKTTRHGFEHIFNLLTDASKGWHAKLIRLPVFHPNGYLANPAGYVAEHLDPAVKLCTAKKVYCIVDLHYFESPYGVTAQAKQFWADISARYKDNPYIFYEIFNEPITGGSNKQAEWDKWKDWAQDIVNLIRSKAPDNIILVGGPHFSSIMRGAVSNPVSGKNIAYVGHMYPGSYHPDPAGANWNNPIGWDYQIGAVALKYPVVITEWGFEKHNNALSPQGTGGTVAGFAHTFKAWAEKYGVSWTAWVADWDWYPAMFNKDYSTNEFGTFAKNWLAEKK